MDIQIMAEVQENIIGNCLCVLGDSMAMPILSMVKHFRSEFEEHMESAREDADREGPGALMARPEINQITFEIDGRDVQRARGHDARGRRQARRRRDPLLLLRAQAGPARGRLPHVPGGDRGHAEAADLLLHAGEGGHGGDHHVRPREARPGGGRGVPAGEPPARLPGVRQGRRVPAAGHLLRLGRRQEPLHRAQAPLPQAAGALPARGDRPRALHPLLPLRALLPGGGRGLPAGVPRARRPHLRRHARRRALRRPVQREHHRAVPGGRAHLHGLPLPRPPVGHRGRGIDLHALPEPVQRDLHRARRREGPARARARQRRGRRRLAVRQGPLRLPGDPREGARCARRS